MIENDAFDDKNLYNLATYIISLIKQFQPAIMDEDVNNWEQGMLQQFTEKFEYSDFLVTFFKSVFNMIENIGNDGLINLWKNMVKIYIILYILKIWK